MFQVICHYLAYRLVTCLGREPFCIDHVRCPCFSLLLFPLPFPSFTSVMLFLRFHCSNNNAFGSRHSEADVTGRVLNSHVMIQYIVRELCYSNRVKVHGIYPYLGYTSD